MVTFRKGQLLILLMKYIITNSLLLLLTIHCNRRWQNLQAHHWQAWGGQFTGEPLASKKRHLSWFPWLLSMNCNAPAQVVETLKEKLNKLTPSAAEPALGCTSQSLWEYSVHFDFLLLLWTVCNILGYMFCLAIVHFTKMCLLNNWNPYLCNI